MNKCLNLKELKNLNELEIKQVNKIIKDQSVSVNNNLDFESKSCKSEISCKISKSRKFVIRLLNTYRKQFKPSELSTIKTNNLDNIIKNLWLVDDKNSDFKNRLDIIYNNFEDYSDNKHFDIFKKLYNILYN